AARYSCSPGAAMSTRARTADTTVPCARLVGWATLGMKKSLGPRLLNDDTALYGTPSVDRPRAPTAITLYPAAGEPTVVGPGPAFPAATATVFADPLPAVER